MSVVELRGRNKSPLGCFSTARVDVVRDDCISMAGMLRGTTSLWLNIAVAGGIEDAAKYWDALTAKMTLVQIGESAETRAGLEAGPK
jgi:hypothetical protein